MANFTINIAAEGYLISDQDRKVSLIISQIGFYIQDNFDFIDDSEDFVTRLFGSQPLGDWSSETEDVASIGMDIDKCWINIDNKFFNDWRDKNNAGGDYVIYSNIYKIPVSMNIGLGKF